ncbi:1-deoxy-D-xylulose-5-phosphate reductoisomerase [Balneola sp. MJW-20]|uniref:1-deoxy-D-xylulose-5-phosphate reductoisomerase n=1 Tax=Gracilimonas aurantiaca TaxID=3234185 RepID=UPI003465D270
MKKEKVALLGSTGSIGTQALDIIEFHAERFEVFALSAHSNWKLLAQQARKFRPEYVVITLDEHYKELKEALSGSDIKVMSGAHQLPVVATHPVVDVVLNSLVGFAGFESTYESLLAGKKVALANKESLVVGGSLISEIDPIVKGKLIPVDSEHSAMLQSLVGEESENIEKIVITASGGPFRSFSKEQLSNVSVEQALKHPNWDMGAKITIDSSTMMNKGLEIIEAKWLFDLPVEKIEPVIHPQSIIHSMVTFVDGSTKAQLGPPNMKVPIIYALSYPGRMDLQVERMDWSQKQQMDFHPVDFDRFPCIKLAIDSVKMGGAAPAVLNASNEVAVDRFLNKEIGYIDIAKIVENSLKHVEFNSALSVETLKEIDKEAREYASAL